MLSFIHPDTFSQKPAVDISDPSVSVCPSAGGEEKERVFFVCADRLFPQKYEGGLRSRPEIDFSTAPAGKRRVLRAEEGETSRVVQPGRRKRETLNRSFALLPYSPLLSTFSALDFVFVFYLSRPDR